MQSHITMSINLLESESRFWFYPNLINQIPNLKRKGILNLYLNPHSFPNQNLNKMYSSLVVLKEIALNRWKTAYIWRDHSLLQQNAELPQSSEKGDLESFWELIDDIIKVLHPLFHIQHHNIAAYSWCIHPLVALLHFLTSSAIQKHFLSTHVVTK